LEDKLDEIYRMMAQWNSSSEMGSGQRPQQHTTLPTPPLTPHTMLNADDLAVLKKQEAQGKISIHIDPFYTSTQPNIEPSTAICSTIHRPNTRPTPSLSVTIAWVESGPPPLLVTAMVP
jgi:hypothetical protein